jgi:DNA modification methylase
MKLLNDDFRNHKIPDNAFVISDPPYNQKYHYLEYGDNLDIQEYGQMLSDAFGGYSSVIISYPEETINIISKAMYADLCEQSVAWVYNSNTAKQHRLVTWWNCKPDFRKIPQPYKNPTDKRIAKRIAEGKQARSYDWWEINQVKNVSKKENPHSCPIPYELAKRIILSTTKEGDLVCDPFAGSGTILLAAKDTGRDYLGFEIDKNYYDYMKKIGL